MRLSKREKTLIIVLLVFGGLALFIAYALVPKLNEVNALKLRVSDSQMMLAQKQMAYESKQDIKARLDEAKAEAKQLYGTLQGNREYDTSLLLSDMLVSCGLMPMQFSIEERTPSTLLGSEEDYTAVYAYSREISLVFSGTRANANRFIDKMASFDNSFVPHGLNMRGGESESYSMRITLYEFDQQDGGGVNDG